MPRPPRDWVCEECGAISLGSSFECFRCYAPKPCGATVVGRQVTAVEDAGPRPCLDAHADSTIHGATSTAALHVVATPPAAYYARAAPKKPESLRLAALMSTEAPRKASQPANRKSNPAHAGNHKDAIAQLKAEQQMKREAAEEKRTEERRARQLMREGRSEA